MSVPDDVPEIARAERQSRRGPLDVLRVVLLLAAVGLGVAAIARDIDGFSAALRGIGAPRATIALLLVSVGLLASAEAWREAVRSVAGALARAAAWRIFFATQLGKYLPGSVWTVVGQIDAAKRHGLARSRMAVAAMLFIGYHLLTGAVVAAVVLPWAAPGMLASYPWALALVPFVLIGLLPAVLRWTIDTGLRVLRRERLPTRLAAGDIVRATAWLFVAWTGYGVAAAVVALPLLEVGAGWQLATAAAGSFALAHVIGVALVPLPAGIGAREVVLAIVLAPMIGATGATSVAIVLRVIHTAADLALAGLAHLGSRGQGSSDRG